MTRPASAVCRPANSYVKSEGSRHAFFSLMLPSLWNEDSSSPFYEWSGSIEPGESNDRKGIVPRPFPEVIKDDSGEKLQVYPLPEVVKAGNTYKGTMWPSCKVSSALKLYEMH